MDARIKEILLKINKEGYQAYLIGGSSRDELLNHPYLDVDITTNAHPKVIESLFEVVSNKGKMFGNIKVKYKDLIAEITTFRLEEYHYPNCYPKIKAFLNDWKEDAIRRDFKINAIYLDANEKVYDCFKGLQDLNAKVINFIKEPKERILEDPSRILRGLRLKEKLNFTFSKATKQAILENINEIKRLSKSKLAYEIKKTYDECGIKQTNQLFKEYFVFKTLFGYEKEICYDNAKAVDLDTILEQLKEL